MVGDMDNGYGNGRDGAPRSKVTVLTGGESGGGILTLTAEYGENLYRLLNKSGIGYNAPCGGGARCGKCLVRVETDLRVISPPSPEELKLLTDQLYGRGYRLACFMDVVCDLTVSVTPLTSTAAKILTSGIKLTAPFEPYVKKRAVGIMAQTLEDQSPDAEHILNGLSAQYPDFFPGDGAGARGRPARAVAPGVFAGAGVLRKLPGVVGASLAGPGGGRKFVTCVCAGDEISGVEPGDTSGRIYGVAFDIGTTTIAGYLFNMADGTPAAVASALNPQAGYGADVITRIGYTVNEPGGAAEMRACVLKELNATLARLAGQGGVKTDEIYSVYAVGNTTMLHFFAGLPAAKIAASPFIPATVGMFRLSGADSGLNVNDACVTTVLPGVSAYVGADTLAAVVACDMDISEEACLLIDIGTNGEIAVGGSKQIFACSTAAGPAFEGASIRNGVGGVEGAVDSVFIDPGGNVSYTTIGGAAVIGICGSGLVDAVAQLLGRGVIDETGRLIDGGEARETGVPAPLAERLTELEGGMRAFKLVDAGGAQDGGGGVYITQRDVRELQNAKAAIAAGIRTLLKISGLAEADVRRIYLAGGFGNYIRAESALDISLIPREFAGRILPAGNAAGAGAVCALLSESAQNRFAELSHKIRYIELSASADFTNAYIDCMTFE